MRECPARKDPAAVALGRKGGKTTAGNLTPEERIEKMRRVAEARWSKTKKLVAEITAGSKELERIAAARTKKARQKKALKP